MRSLVFLLVGLALASAFDDKLDGYWKVFKQRHNKIYGKHEDILRRTVWEKHLKYINQHNLEADLGLHSHRLGMNEHGDMTQREYKAMLGFANSTRKGINFLPPQNVALPKSVDWRQAGAVTPIKNQGRCGSCWAFASTGALEAQMALKTGKLISLSEQNLVDCSSQNHGCNGGNPDLAFEYIKNNHGIDDEADYPYTGMNGQCHFKRSDVAASDTGFVDVPSQSPAAMQQAVASIGPLAVAFDASAMSFRFYRSGVYTSYTCSKRQLDHAVLIIGYGVDKGFVADTPYWLVKNSWGTTWGKEGYFKIKRGSNECGIELYPSYPTV